MAVLSQALERFSLDRPYILKGRCPRNSFQPLLHLDPGEPGWNALLGQHLFFIQFEKTPAKRDLVFLKQPGYGNQIVDIPELGPSHLVELRIVEHLTVNAGNLSDRLPVRSVIDCAEIKGRPLREQRIRSSKRGIMNSQKALEFGPTLLQGFQLCLKFALALIVTVKVFTALFAFKYRYGGFGLPAVQTDSGDIDSKSRSRSTNLHCAATVTTVVRPKERPLLQAPVQFRLAGRHVLFLVTVLRKAARSAEIHGEEQKKTGDPASHGASRIGKKAQAGK
jgi:hypothetical protein